MLSFNIFFLALHARICWKANIFSCASLCTDLVKSAMCDSEPPLLSEFLSYIFI